MQGGEVTQMRFYVASRLSCRPQLHEVRSKLRSLGHDVISTWLDESGDYSNSLEQAKKVAMRDLCQISQVDVLILDTTSPISKDGGGGRETEFGFALGQFQNKKLWRVGPIKNVFHALVDLSFENFEELLDYVKEGKKK